MSLHFLEHNFELHRQRNSNKKKHWDDSCSGDQISSAHYTNNNIFDTRINRLVGAALQGSETRFLHPQQIWQFLTKTWVAHLQICGY